MKRIALNLLAWLAGKIAAKYKLKVVAITGSVGKTTAKETIYFVLASVYDVQRNLYNANTEWGVAASVIDPGFEPTFAKDGKAKISLGQYCRLIWQAKMKLLFTYKYPQIMVLELAADRPGDLKWFNRWFKYDAAVITTIGNSHLEFYKDQAELTAEKLSLLDGLKPNGLAVMNGECEACWEYINKSQQRKASFGWGPKSQYWAEANDGVSYVLHTPQDKFDIQLPVGRHYGLAAAAAAAVGEEFGLTKEQIQMGLGQFQPLSGRFQIRQGERWIIIDDTYNASPESMEMALKSLQQAAKKRRVAILGGMRELGTDTEASHRKVGEWAAKMTDLLIVAGKEGEAIGEGARAAGMQQEKIVKLIWDENNPRPDEAMSQLLPILEEGDSVLVKASRAIHLDLLVDKLLAQKTV